jgi:hypothetical protein
MGSVNQLMAECLSSDSAMTSAFAAGIMTSLLELTLLSVEQDANHAQDIISVGFDAFWRAIST